MCFIAKSIAAAFVSSSWNIQWRGEGCEWAGFTQMITSHLLTTNLPPPSPSSTPSPPSPPLPPSPPSESCRWNTSHLLTDNKLRLSEVLSPPAKRLRMTRGLFELFLTGLTKQVAPTEKWEFDKVESSFGSLPSLQCVFWPRKSDHNIWKFLNDHPFMISMIIIWWQLLSTWKRPSTFDQNSWTKIC